MRRLLGCLVLVLAAACGGSSSGGGGSVAPPDDGGVVNDGGTTSPTPDAGPVADAGAPVTDAGTPSTPDAGTTPPADGGTTTPPPSDGGTVSPPADGGTASACDGLAPGPVGAPSGSFTNSLPRGGYSCSAAVNGSGGLALYEFNEAETPDKSSNRTDFFAPDGTPRGTRFRGSSPEFGTPMLGRLNAFFDTEVANGHYQVVAQDDHGSVLQTTVTGYTAQLVDDPLGGAMLWGYDVSDFGETGPFVLSAFDDAGALRFQVTIASELGNGFAGLVVDQKGNAIFLAGFVDKSGAATSGLMGQWITHGGKLLPPFTVLPAGQVGVDTLFARIGGGVFFRHGGDWSQLDSLSTTVTPGPAWLSKDLNGLAKMKVAMARNSRAYAIIGQDPTSPTDNCTGDEVQVIAPTGEICGKATFPSFSTTSGTTNCNGLRTIGYDGTLVQTEGNFTDSTNSCVWHWWTGFFH